MPVEITMPLTKLEQRVADARAHEQIMAAKVEDAKLSLKSAKTAWEEAVGAVFLAVDEMIADKRQPSLFGDDDEASATGSGQTPNDPTPSGGGSGGSEDGKPASEEAGGDGSENGDKNRTTVEVIEVPLSSLPAAKVLSALTSGKDRDNQSHQGHHHSDTAQGSASLPSWRMGHVTEHVDGPPSLFETFELFGVNTLGQLADALQAGKTLNLTLLEIYDLQEVIEDASQEDEKPIRFDREATIPVTVKGVKEELKEEVVKPAAKKRGRKKKGEVSEAANRDDKVDDRGDDKGDGDDHGGVKPDNQFADL